MAVCKNCGTELVKGAKFCKSCGTPVSNASSFFQNKAGWLKRILTVALPIGLTVAGTGAYGLFKGGLPGKGNVGNELVNELINKAGNMMANEVADEVANEVANNNEASSYQPNVLPQAKNSSKGTAATSKGTATTNKGTAAATQSATNSNDEFINDGFVGDLDNVDGMINIEDMTPQQRKAYEERLEGSHDIQYYENAYQGTWKSVGIAPIPYKEVENLKKMDVATRIDQRMIVSDNVRLYMDKGQLKLTNKGRTILTGKYTILEDGNISVETPSGGTGTIWMFSTIDSVLFSYIFYEDDDGTEMASCMKLGRINKKGE